MREEKTFRVVVFRFETDASTNYTRYMITKNYMPFFPGNQWLELKSIRKTSTGKEYAKKLVAFLNWLDSRKVTYENATNHHVREFLHELVFGNLADEKVLSLQSSVGYSTLTKYVTVITGFYGWLDDMRQTEMLWKKKSVQANCSFLYGQIYSREYRYLIDGYAARLKSSRDYTKWYDKATKELLCRNFNTLRDEAVLRLTFEGFRIDEVLSVTLDSYDAIEQLVQPTRSKGRAMLTAVLAFSLLLVNSFCACFWVWLLYLQGKDGQDMTAGYKNLCAEIPEALHAKVRQRQTESGISLSQYVTGLIIKYYEMEENLKMDKDNVRTVAFQVPVELFEQFKAYLKRNGVKQNAFFLNCIQQALEQDGKADRE